MALDIGQGIPRSFPGVDPQDPWFDANHGNAKYYVDGNGLFYISDRGKCLQHDFIISLYPAISWSQILFPDLTWQSFWVVETPLQ